MDDYSNTLILARVSGKEQVEGYSLDSQHKLLQTYSANLNLNVIKVFQFAETASKEKSRKVFQEMMHFASLKKNNVYNIVVEKTDRYTRNFKDAVALDDWLEYDANRKLHAVKENLILHKNSKSEVKYLWNINVASAKKFTDNLREEAMKGWAEKLAQGWLPAPPPAGYMTITHEGRRIHVPDPKTKNLIKKVFENYLEPDQSIATTVELMKNMGFRSRGGRPFVKSHVQKLLNNPFYIGINRFDGKDYKGAQERLISKDVFDRVQKKMIRKVNGRYRQHNPVFKNIIRCNNCKGMITWQLQKGRFYGACQRSTEACRGRKLLREDRVEELITQMLENLVCPSQAIIQWVADSMHEQHSADIEEQEQLWNSVKTQIDRLTRMEEGLYEDKLAGDISQVRYQEKHAMFSAQKVELEKQLRSIDRSFGNRLDQALVLLELSQRAAELYAKKRPHQKRLIITKLLENIHYDNDSLSVSYTKFAQVIANNVLETKKLIGGQK